MTSAATPPTATTPAACDPHQGCITCGDEGVVMRVTAVGEDGLGACTGPDGSGEVVELALVAPVGPGDEVLVHAGVALVRLEAGAAA